MSLLELRRNILNEFTRKLDDHNAVHLTYWPANTQDLASGIITPPVILSNDGSLRFFCKHHQLNNELNLFVNFGDHPKSATGKEATATAGCGSTTPPVVDDAAENIKDVSKLDDGAVDERRYVSTAASKYTPQTDLDEPTHGGGLVVETPIDDIVHNNDSWVPDFKDGQTASETESGNDLDDVDVFPRGYDADFWYPLR